MTCRFGRREMIAGALAAGTGIALSLEERVLLAQTAAAPDAGAGKAQPGGAKALSGGAKALSGGAKGQSDASDRSDGSDGSDKRKPGAQPVKASSKGALATGKIKDAQISRIIMGGNLIGGWAHSRDLKYCSELVKQYHTTEKILETLQLGEEYGVNCINTVPNGRDFMIRYWREHGGKMKWMVQLLINSDKQLDEITRLVDDGAWGIHLQGGIADGLAQAGKADIIAKIVETIRERGAVAGYACHDVETLQACDKAGVKADFIIKTLHSRKYWSARPEDEATPVINNRADNCWCRNPDETIAYMKKYEIPWVAFKVLAAGAIPPHEGLQYAFDNGADFCMVGMFDFQVAQDMKIANEVLGKVKRGERPWRA